MKLIAASVGLLLLAGCATQPEPICDREAQSYDKFGTPEDLCVKPKPRPIFIAGLPDTDDPHDPTMPPPRGPEDPDNEPPVSRPDPEDDPRGGPRGNNGWGNGDQSAPGKSLDRNKAENSGGQHRNHGPSVKN